jgi:ribose 5-phosphate isomerase A
MSSVEDLKRQAALEAVKRVKSGMKVGLGTGSTAKHAVIAIGEMLKAGTLKDVVGVPTSVATEQLAREWNIPLATLTKDTKLDVAIDGADEVDPQGDLIKGGGGAMLRERAVEEKARGFVVIVDQSKLSPKLGVNFALPVEVAIDAVTVEADNLEKLGAQVTRRGGDAKPFVTDNGNAILDARFAKGIDDPRALANALEARPSVKAHGLFLGMANALIVAAPEGIRVRDVKP